MATENLGLNWALTQEWALSIHEAETSTWVIVHDTMVYILISHYREKAILQVESSLWMHEPENL